MIAQRVLTQGGGGEEMDGGTAAGQVNNEQPPYEPTRSIDGGNGEPKVTCPVELDLIKTPERMEREKENCPNV